MIQYLIKSLLVQKNGDDDGEREVEMMVMKWDLLRIAEGIRMSRKGLCPVLYNSLLFQKTINLLTAYFLKKP